MPHPKEQHVTVQVVEPGEGRPFTESLFQGVIFGYRPGVGTKRGEGGRGMVAAN